MKDQIKKVQDYFKNKIINGEYEVEKQESYTMHILIDSEYKFVLWMANDGYNFSLYSGYFNTVELSFSEYEATQAYSEANIVHAKYKQEYLIKQKREELQELEASIKES